MENPSSLLLLGANVGIAPIHNSVRTHSSHLNSECERVVGGGGVRRSLVSATEFPSRAAPIPPAGIKNGREIRLGCPEAAEQVITAAPNQPRRR